MKTKGVTKMTDYSALNSNADSSGLPRVKVLYENQLLPNGRNGGLSFSSVPAGANNYVVDIETAYRIVPDGYYFTQALSGVRSAGGANSKVSLFYGFPFGDCTAGSRQDTRELWMGTNLAIQSVGDSCDFYSPCWYLEGASFGLENWKKFVRRSVAACWENNPGKILRPFLWHCYVDNNQQIDTVTWQAMITFVRNILSVNGQSGDGIIFWSGSWETTYLPRMIGL